MSKHPDRDPEIEILHHLRLGQAEVWTLTIDDCGYCVVPTPRGFRFERHQGEKRGGTVSTVTLYRSQPVFCDCADRKYRGRRCKHFATAAYLLSQERSIAS